MSNAIFKLEQNENYALISWKSNELNQSNSLELEDAIRNLFKKGYANMILDIKSVDAFDGYGVSCIRKGTKICTNENGLFVVICKNEAILARLDEAKIEELTLFNTVSEGVDAIFFNDMENDFKSDDEDEFGGGDSYDDLGDEY